jgi:hypothetical protein
LLGEIVSTLMNRGDSSLRDKQCPPRRLPRADCRGDVADSVFELPAAVRVKLKSRISRR